MEKVSKSQVGREAALSFEEVNRRIVDTYDQLPGALKNAANIVSQNPNDIAILNLSQLSDRYGVPASNFVRLSKALDIDGFSSLQEVFRARLIDIIPSLTSRMNRLKDDLAAEVAPDIEAGTLIELEIRQDFDVLTRRASADLSDDCLALGEAVANADRIGVLAGRHFYSAAVYLNAILVRLGVDAHLLDGAGFDAAQMAVNLRRGDLVIGIDFHQYNRALVDVLEIASAAGATLFNITDYEFSPLAKLADRVLLLPGLEAENAFSIAPVFTVLQVVAADVERRVAGE